ncbi:MULTISPECIES: hypothetical protein [unclassified Bradyrhizobium]|uniref:hypothetical protein n=1 Tax=unclassified Bradyrhizobium TaxID=2631580 RepID=UPI0024798CFA|nr:MULTISPECIES: hypothetical protein [unclassified Bradyrhizobium]WGR67839.1 hypothetical protein MTX24_20435 [Bradyrhizobium sp. ISRA426]WGR79892.1 hypothetical protein MTX21_05550 [Bradyrhizobium sp. ISRA430]WGR83078.1 hypothetical protein MTX25_20115 [Bradyrhizobium sp. ISRA432]
MSETEQPRSENGQFTSGNEQLFGRSAELVDHGWVEPDKPKEEEPEASLDDQLRQAADALADSRFSGDPFETSPIELTHGGEKAADNLALTPEEASDSLKQWRADEAETKQVLEDAEFLESIGLDPLPPQLQQPAEAAQDGVANKSAEAQQQPADQHQHEADELGKALANPVIVEALKGEFAKAEQVRSAYAQTLDNAVAVAEFSFLSQFPEFRGVTDAGHLKSIANSIAVQNPQRWQAIQQTAAQAGQLVQAQAAERAHAAQARQADLDRVGAEHDGKFAAWEKTLPETTRRAAAAELPAMFAEAGVSVDDFAREMKTNPALRHHAFQRMVMEAAAYRAMQKNVPKALPKNLPPVQRPGTAQPRAPQGVQDVSRANARFQASGSIDDALELLSAQRASRG